MLYEVITNRMYGVMEFYKACVSNNIKPIIGLEVIMEKKIVLYVKDINGYKNLVKLSTISSERTITLDDLKKYSDNLICIVPYESIDLYDRITSYNVCYTKLLRHQHKLKE